MGKADQVDQGLVARIAGKRTQFRRAAHVEQLRWILRGGALEDVQRSLALADEQRSPGEPDRVCIFAPLNLVEQRRRRLATACGRQQDQGVG